MTLLDARGVSFRFTESDHASPNISLSAGKGEIILVTGPSGSGKSTLARMLSGLIPNLYKGQMKGSVTVGSLDTRTAPLWQLSGVAGMVFQNPANQMLEHSVEDEIIFGLENLGLGREDIYRKTDSILKDFSLEPYRQRKPQTLSGGEQQKLALAAIMARSPQILILDEPFSMLDISASQELVKYIQELSDAGTTILIFEHRAEILTPLDNLRVIDIHPPPRSDRLPSTAPGELKPPVSTTKEISLEVRGVSVSLGGKPVLEDLSFGLMGGQSLAIVGRNGTGKTTLLRSLAGLQKHDGNVTINREKPELGLVFQNADLQLFNASVKEEILYRQPAPNMDRYHTILNLLHLQYYEDSPPLLLSEGEKKRVALAVMLMSGPSHGILLDEPSLGQDNYHKTILVRLIQELKSTGQIVIFATHDLRLAASADQILLLGDTGVIAQGPTNDILNQPELWRLAGLIIPEWMEL